MAKQIGELDAPAASRRAQGAVLAVIVAVAAACVWFEIIHAGGLQQSAALFIGLPAVLGIVVVVGVIPRTAAGLACKAVSVGLIISLMLFKEGFLCIGLSAPLFYAVAIAIAHAAEGFRDRGPTRLQCVVGLTLLLAFEGVTPATTVERDQWVTVTRTVEAPVAEVARALHAAPRFDRPLPLRFARGSRGPSRRPARAIGCGCGSAAVKRVSTAPNPRKATSSWTACRSARARQGGVWSPTAAT